MKAKMKFSIILIFICFTTYSQLLPDNKVIFKNFKGYTAVGKNLFGKIVRTGEANTKFDISSVGISTFFSFESTLFDDDGAQAFKVSNVIKEQKNGKLLRHIETYNAEDPNTPKKVVKFIFEYVDKDLVRVFLLTESGALEFY